MSVTTTIVSTAQPRFSILNPLDEIVPAGGSAGSAAIMGSGLTKPMVNQFITSLFKILDPSDPIEQWQDTLSQKIICWGAEVLNTAEEMEREWSYGGLSHDRITIFIGTAHKNITTLMREILIDPLTDKPLVDPYLDRDWVWEKQALDDYQRLTDLSPFDGIKMQIKAHTLAKQMLGWVHTLPAEFLPQVVHSKELTAAAPMALTVAAEVDSKESKESKILKVQLLAQKSITIEKTRNRTKLIEEAAAVLVIFDRKMDKRVEEEKLALKKQQEANEQNQKQQVATLEQTHQKTIASFQTNLGNVTQHVSTLQGQLVSTQSIVARQGSEIRQLNSKYCESQKKIERLENEAFRKQDNCTIL